MFRLHARIPRKHGRNQRESLVCVSQGVFECASENKHRFLSLFASLEKRHKLHCSLLCISLRACRVCLPTGLRKCSLYQMAIETN